MLVSRLRISRHELLRGAALASALGAASVAANADPLPVIAVNREIGLSALGTFTGLEQRSSYLTSSRYAYQNFSGGTDVFNGHYGEYARRRADSWTPGFEANAQVMFDLGRVKRLYVAGTFDLGDGRQHSRRTEYETDDYGSSTDQGQGTQNRSYTNSWGEIGKGFLFDRGRLLITPVVQGGYYSYGPRYTRQVVTTGIYTFGAPLNPVAPRYIAHDQFDAFGNGYVGLAVHADYALTNALVLRGRAGWAQMLDTHEYTDLAPRAYHGDTRPLWQGDLGLDYRMTRHFHLTGGVRYTYIDFGRAHGSADYDYSSSYYSETSHYADHGTS